MQIGTKIFTNAWETDFFIENGKFFPFFMLLCWLNFYWSSSPHSLPFFSRFHFIINSHKIHLFDILRRNTIFMRKTNPSMWLKIHKKEIPFLKSTTVKKKILSSWSEVLVGAAVKMEKWQKIVKMWIKLIKNWFLLLWTTMRRLRNHYVSFVYLFFRSLFRVTLSTWSEKSLKNKKLRTSTFFIQLYVYTIVLLHFFIIIKKRTINIKRKYQQKPPFLIFLSLSPPSQLTSLFIRGNKA